MYHRIGKKNYVKGWNVGVKKAIWSFLILLLLILVAPPCYAEWARTYGGSGYDLFNSLQNTNDGGYIIVGGTYSYGNGSVDAMILKLDINGNIQWQKVWGGPREDAAHSVKQTSEGGYIVAGQTRSYGSGDYDNWVAKLDQMGNIQWQKLLGGSGRDECYSVQVTRDGGYILAGYSNSSPAQDFDALIIKLDQNGEIQWQKLYGGPGRDYAFQIKQTSDGGFIFCGVTSSSACDCNFDGWIVRINAEGNVQWQKRYDLGGEEIFTGIIETIEGGYLAVGRNNRPNNNEGWIVKLDNSGGIEWQKRYGGSSHDDFGTIQQNDDGGYIVIGDTSSFGAGNRDGWLLRLDNQGNIIWQNTYGGTNWEERYHETLVKNLLGGYSIIFHTMSFGAGSMEGWLLNLNENGEIPGCFAVRPSSAVVVNTTAVPNDTNFLVKNSNFFPLNIGISFQDIHVQESFTCFSQVNHPPVFSLIGDKVVNEGELLQFMITATDPDGDLLIYSTTGLPPGATFDPATRIFSWTPNYDQAGIYQVLFTVTDNGTPPLSAQETIMIKIENVNRPPQLNPTGNRPGSEGQVLQFTVSATDPDGNGLTYSSSSLPQGATLNPETGVFQWTPGFEQAGEYSVQFTVTDKGFPPLSAQETIMIKIENVNRSPKLNPIGNKLGSEGQVLQFTISATDPDPVDVLTYSAPARPAGAMFDKTTQTFSWTPAYNQSGTYQVTFTVTDDGSPNLSDVETITITVDNVNRPPVIAPIEDKILNEGELLQFQVAATDPDEWDILTYSVVDWNWDPIDFELKDLPGAFFNPTNQAFTWSPGYLQAGVYTLVFKVVDNGTPSLNDTRAVSIKVGDVNLPPSASPSGGGTYEVNTPVFLGGEISDFDGDLLTYKWKWGGTILNQGQIQSLSGGTPLTLPQYTISTLPVGEHTIVLEVTDKDPEKPVEKSIIVKIIDTFAPIINPISNKGILWPPNHKMEDIVITANAKDNSGQPVTLTATVSSNEPIDGLGDGDTAPDWMEPIINQVTGVITLQLRAERAGGGNGRIYTINITATDKSNNSSTAKVEVIVPLNMKKK